MTEQLHFLFLFYQFSGARWIFPTEKACHGKPKLNCVPDGMFRLLSCCKLGRFPGPIRSAWEISLGLKDLPEVCMQHPMQQQLQPCTLPSSLDPCLSPFVYDC